MAKKNAVKSGFKCGQCALPVWDDDNLTNEGKRFLLRCKHFKNGEVFHFAKDNSCEHFVMR